MPESDRGAPPVPAAAVPSGEDAVSPAAWTVPVTESPASSPTYGAVGNAVTLAPRTVVLPRRQRIRRRVRHWTAALLALALLVVGGSYAWRRIAASGHQYSVAQAPAAPVALVLGAGLRQDGSPSEYLAYRLDDAAALYRSGKVQVLLVSGANGTTSHDEPDAMRDYLVAQGVPATRVVRDYAGFDTWDSCSRARHIFGADRILVVTQTFHLPRAVFLCRQAGLDADGVADDRPVNGVSNSVREVPGAVKSAWDVVFQTDPTFLGPPEHSVDHALGDESDR